MANGTGPAIDGPPRAGSPRVLAAVLAIATAGVLPPFLIAAAGVRLQGEFGLSDAALGAMISTFFVVAGLVSRPMGFAVDRIGWRRSARRVAPVSIAVMLTIAWLIRDPVHLFIALAIGGSCHGATAPIANLALVEELSSRRHGVLFGIKQSAPSAALFLGGLAVPTLIATAGWRVTFLAAAALPTIALITVPRPGGARREPRRLHGRRRPQPRAHADTSSARPGPRSQLTGPTIAGALAAATVTATSSFLLVTMVAAGSTERSAGLVLSAGAIVSIVARVAIGWQADRRQGQALQGVTVLLGIGAAGHAAIASGQPVLLLAGAMLAFAAGSGWPGLFQLAIVRRYTATAAAATGTVQTGLSLGAAVGPVLFGVLADRWSYAAAWSTTSAAAVAASLLVVITVLQWRRTDTSVATTR